MGGDQQVIPRLVNKQMGLDQERKLGDDCAVDGDPVFSVQYNPVPGHVHDHFVDPRNGAE